MVLFIYMDQKQIDYVTAELARGVSPEELRTTLLGAGYTDVQIDALLQVVAGGISPIPAAGEQGIVKKGMPTWVTVLLWIVAGLIVIIVLLGGVVLGSLNIARDSANSASDKTTLNNLRNQAEIYFNADSSFAGFCESSAVSLAAVRLPNIVCVDSVELYRVSARLQDGAYFCIAGDGFLGEVVTQPTGLSCELPGAPDNSAEANIIGLQQEEDADLVGRQSDQADAQNLQFMRFAVEIYYDENNFAYSGFCESSEGRSALEDIEGVECFAAGPAYRVSKELVSGGYYCIDGTGTAGRFDTSPIGLSC